MKNRFFAEEKEFRAVLVPRGGELLQFRLRDNLFVPYIVVAAEDGIPVRSIAVGPASNKEYHEAGIREYVKSRGLKDDVSIMKSGIPYRN